MGEHAKVVDEAMASGLADAPESDVEEVVVDTSRDRPVDEIDDAEPLAGEVLHLPVRREVAEHQQLGTLIPVQEELRGAAALAVTLAMAGNVPKALKGKPADVLAVIMTGRELGVAPMTAIRTFHVIDGTVTVAPKVRAAMVRAQGLGKLWPHQAPERVVCPLLDSEKHSDACVLCEGSGVQTRLCRCGSPMEANDGDVATWHGERADQPGVIFTSTFTLAMAGAVQFDKWEGDRGNRRKVGTSSLLDKDNWKNYPERMLSWRSLGYLLDDAFPEVGTGLYSPDEIGAVTDEEGTPILDVESTETLVPPTEEQQARRRVEERQRRNSTQANEQANEQESPADPETLDRFQKRIEALGRYAGAVEALKALWIEHDENGVPRLPALGELRRRHMQKASAMIDSIERRASKGEFGEPKPAGPESPAKDAEKAPESVENGSGSDSPSDGAESVSEPPSAVSGDSGAPFDVSDLPTDESQSADLAWAGRAPQELVDEVAAEIKDLASAELDSRLEAAKRPTTGKLETKQMRLAAFTMRRRMERLVG